ncbi:hypothetical protein C6503_20305 [Candidatus Poribacteria bacterium]|nr:MAG: hypothetical protein C6503_20305 [Candidatus Poribacteria bacterium]
MEQDRDETLQQIAEKALTNSVVHLDVKREMSLEALRPQFNISEIKTSSGSGFFIQQQLIVTNFHVVAGAASVTAKLSGTGDTFQIEGVTALDIENDLALLKVVYEGKPLTLGDSDRVRKRDLVCAIGYPKGVGKIVNGTIHAIKRNDNRIQMKIGTSTGSSGCPILNSHGQVIGIHTSSDNSHGYAILVNTLKDLIKETGEPEAFKALQERPFVRAYVHAKTGDEKRKHGEYKAAIAYYDAALKLNPNMADVYAHRANAKTELSSDLGSYMEALDGFHTAFRLQPLKFSFSNLRAFFSRLSLLFYIFLFKALIQCLRTVFGRRGWLMLQGFWHARDAKSAADSGDKAEAKKLYQQAVGNYTDAINLKPKRANAYNSRGWTKYLFGQFETEQGNAADAQRLYQEAVFDSDEALRLQQKSAKFRSVFFHTRGAAKAGLRDHNGAIEDFNESIQLNPKKALLYHDRGLSKEVLGQHEEAIVDFQKAKELDPAFEK